MNICAITEGGGRCNTNFNSFVFVWHVMLQVVLGRTYRLFSFMRHGLHRKRRLRQFFVAAGTLLRSYHLATIGGYTEKHTDSPLIIHGPHRKWRSQQFFHCCSHLAKKGDKQFTEPLPSNDKTDTQKHTDWWVGFMEYAIKIGSGVMIHIPSFIKIGSGIHRHTDSMEIA
jgi:hypothetical protein